MYLIIKINDFTVFIDSRRGIVNLAIGMTHRYRARKNSALLIACNLGKLCQHRRSRRFGLLLQVSQAVACCPHLGQHQQIMLFGSLRCQLQTMGYISLFILFQNFQLQQSYFHNTRSLGIILLLCRRPRKNFSSLRVQRVMKCSLPPKDSTKTTG